ncbi:MAG: arginase family protein, partial [Bacillota bacterium]
RQRRLIRCTRHLAERVERSITQGRLPLILGDCTAGVGAFAGLRRRRDDVAVVWVDAHCDLNTEASTLTGYLGGMPLAAILGESLPWLTAAAGMNGRCDERRVALVGAREFDPYERSFLDRSRITRVTCRELNDSGRAGVAAAAVAGPAEAVYLHIDVDALDPAMMPSVTFPSPGGLTIDSLLALVDAVASSGKVRALAVTSFNPHRGDALESAETLTRLISRIASACCGSGV